MKTPTDEERSYQAHIAGSDHIASDGFAARLPELARATTGKDTLVFLCALSQVILDRFFNLIPSASLEVPPGTPAAGLDLSNLWAMAIFGGRL